jgi:hypothetical protein
MDCQPMEGEYQYGTKKYKRKKLPRPLIDEKCWLEHDLQFWLTGDYDMTEEHQDVQVMLDLASMLNSARIEWAMAKARATTHDGHGTKDIYRDPRHVHIESTRRGGFGVSRE